MNLFVNWLAAAALLLSTASSTAFAGSSAETPQLPRNSAAPTAGAAAATSCLYPSAHERFGITVDGDITRFDVSTFPVGSYMDWSTRANPPHPNNMVYFPMIRPTSTGFWPSGADLAEAVRNTPSATWMIGNEAETVWMDNLTPEQYARAYHDATTAIKALDPTAKFAFTSIATVSTLRLAWLDMVLSEYRRLYGADPEVDMWTVHTYVVNEMANEWGAEIPTGIANAVGYNGPWTEAALAGASGGTVHQSRQTDAKAYFAFRGPQAVLYLRTGPDAGRAAIYIDHRSEPVETVDLYAETPGSLTRTYSNLARPSDPRLGNRHHLRVQVTGLKHPSSSNTWVRVDALAAASTVNLTGGRLENNDPLQARIVTNIDNHDNISMIADQVRRFRQWMAANGQRNKPLVNSEYGILMTEDLGFDYPRVRTFMLNSFDLFVNDLQDPQLGLPADDNRLLQQWFWFALNQDTFEGRVVHTGLYNNNNTQIKPLGQEFINYVRPLVQSYLDLETTSLSLTPTWPLFEGEPSRVQVQAEIVNRGIAASGPFTVQLTEGTTVANSWPVPGLAKRFDSGDRITLTGEWRPVVYGNRTVTLTADKPQQTTDNCRANNVRSATLVAPAFTDLAVANLRTDPPRLTPVGHGETMTVTLQVDVLNLGSRGADVDHIRVRFWDTRSPSGDVLLHTSALERGAAPVPVQLAYAWPNLTPGIYSVAVSIDAVPGDTNLANNRQTLRFMVPAQNMYLPLLTRRYQTSRTLSALPPDAPAAGKAGLDTGFLPK